MQQVPSSFQKKVSGHIKHLLKQTIETMTPDLEFISIFYNFTNPEAPISPTGVPQFVYYDSLIQLRMEDGAIIKDSSMGIIKIDDEILFKTGKAYMDDKVRIIGLIPGFRLKRIPTSLQGLPFKNVKWLTENAHKVNTGESFNTLFQTTHFLATRDPAIDIERQNTIGRYIIINDKTNLTFNFLMALRKRRLEENSSSSSGGSKEELKKKKTSAASIIL